MFYTIKKLTMVFIVSYLFMFQSLMADMMFYYNAAILPSIIASKQQISPVAEAGEDKSTIVNQAVTIIGSGTDSDGTIVSYEWKKGSEVLSTDATFSYIPTAVGIDVLTLTVIDNDDNNDTDTMTVTVTDGTAPVISVTGSNPLSVDQDSTYIDAGATATDDVDDTVTVITTGSVDTSIVGEYILTYTAEDSAGNQAIPKTRTVHVVDVTPPVITITGDVAPTVEHKSTYIDAGATATDNVDTTVTVTSSGSVDTNILGDYAITYNAVDVAGNNAIAVERTVHVVDTIAPIFTSLSTALVDENQNAAITLVATDTNTITYSMSGGDANDFDINNVSGVVTFKTAPDYESGKTTYTFTAKATDGASNVAEQSVTISIKDIVDTAPTLGNTDLEVVENAEEGTVVGSVIVVDSGDSAITGFTLTGTGEGNFTIDSSGEIVVATGATLDYETTPVYHLNAVASNGFGTSASVSVTINVDDIEELLNPFQIAKIRASDGNISDNFGRSVAIDGEYIIVGAYEKRAAYLYKKQADGKVIEIAKIQSNYSELGNYFGVSVAIDGDYIVIGAQAENGGEGCAYVFKRISDSSNDIVEIAKIQASNASSGSYFGGSVSISGNYIVVGAYLGDSISNNEGSAYLFKINSDTNVTEIAKIQASDAQIDDRFGVSVAIDGDYIVIGAYAEDENGDDSGSTYVYKRNSDAINDITQISKIKASDGQPGDYFGWSVSMSGDFIVVGAFESGDGKVYLFKKYSDTNIAQIQIIQATDSEDIDQFGWSVSIDNNYFIVGGALSFWSRYHNSHTASIASYLFKINSDTEIIQVATLKANDTDKNDGFGSSVNIDGNNIIIGAMGKYNNEGRAYIYDMQSIDKPYIYMSSSIINHPEQLSKFVYHLNAASPVGGLVSYELSGVDATHFILNEDNLTFDLNADFEAPVDENEDNDYNITVTAVDTNMNSSSMSVNILVKDRSYLEQKIQSISEVDNRFGITVSSSGEYIVVGAPHENNSLGYVYIYKKQIDGKVIEVAKIQSNDIEVGDNFGSEVAIDREYIVVSAAGEDTKGNNAGSIYLFKINSDTEILQIAKFQANDTESNDQFGTSISIGGDYIVVGASYDDSTGNKGGSAYLFKRNSDTMNDITEIAKIKADPNEYVDEFGWAVSIDGNYIVVGGREHDGVTTDNTYTGTGAAFVFKRNSDTSVTRLAKLKASDPESWAGFGVTVSISGDYIVIGAPGSNANGHASGSAYVFKRYSDSSITQITQLQENYPEQYRSFGSEVSISSDSIIVGAQPTGEGQNDTNSISLFKINSDTNISQVKNFKASSIVPYPEDYGSSLSIDNDFIVVGTRRGSYGENVNSIYMYQKDENQIE